MTNMSSQAVSVGFVSALVAMLVSGCDIFTETYDEVALCENMTHQRVDEDYCHYSKSEAVSWVFISSSSDYRVGSYGQFIDANRVSRTPNPNSIVSYGGLKGVTSANVNAVPKGAIANRSYTSPGVVRGGLGVSAGKAGGSGGGS